MGDKGIDHRELSVRERRVLYFTIHKFIHEHEPIGSRTIAKAFDYDMSPATVRNICADLEEWGFLDQPHTSAGRQPTDTGYRYYINELIQIQEVAQRQREKIVREYEEKMGSLDDILQKTAKLLSTVTQHTAVVIHPDQRHVEISRLSLMLDKPDFKNISQLGDAMRILEEPHQIGEIFKVPAEKADDIDIKLGSELHKPELVEFGVIKTSYQVDENTTGTLGVVGPKRMPYGRLITLVRTIKEAVNNACGRMRRR